MCMSASNTVEIVLTLSLRRWLWKQYVGQQLTEAIGGGKGELIAVCTVKRRDHLARYAL